MSTMDKALSIARGEVGYTEGKNNYSKYAADLFPTVNHMAWCGSFVGWVYAKAGFAIGSRVWVPYVPYVANWARKNGFWKTSSPNPGDLVIYDWNGGNPDHIGIAWPDPNAQGYRAIEGNTSPTNRGSQSNGGGVHVRYRGRRSIEGWVDMQKVLARYAGERATTVAVKAVKQASGALVVDGRLGRKTAQELQEFLRARGHDIAVDGRLGPDSWRAFQDYLGTPVDGVVSNQSHRHDALGNGIAPRGWDYDGPGAKGSTMVRALQKWVKVGQDGVWGEATTRGLQAKLNAHNAGA